MSVKHSDSINNELILKLVNLLDGGDFTPEESSGSFEYFVTDGLLLDGKRYRLIWLIEKNELFIGVINAYRMRS